MKKILLWLLIVIIPILLGGGIYQAYSTPIAPQPDPQWKSMENSIKTRVQLFPGTAGIYIKDLKHGWVVEHNTSRLFASASLVKLPIMAALYTAQMDGRISLDETIELNWRNKARGSGKLKFVRNGERFSVRYLIFKMITESDNTATNMLTNQLGLEFYNHSFINMGLNHTNMSRTIMDLRQRDRGVENYTTANDMGKLLEMIYHNRIVGSSEMMEILKSQTVNDRLPVPLPEDWQIGHKTGLLRNTCHDVGIVYSPNRDYIICVLTQNIRNYRRAKSFIREVSHLTANYYTAAPKVIEEPSGKLFWSKIIRRAAHERT